MPALSLRSAFALSAIGAMSCALILVCLQTPFAASFFDFGNFSPHQGEVSLKPYPVLRTARGLLPLVAPGKFGAENSLAGMDGVRILIRASSIRRDATEMLELQPESIRPLQSTVPANLPAPEDLGTYTFSGEIVDSKCFLGVMNPGAGRVHRECAIRCISGGVPPIFVVTDGNGKNRFLWLTDASGRPLLKAMLDYVAEPVQLSGQLVRHSNLLYFQVALDSLRRE